METEKLYYEDPFRREFSARVISCRADKGGFAVVLDRTAFYPEGGGQGADHGTLGGAAVLDVHEKDGVIVHLCDRELPVGEPVEGRLDWKRRFDHMQQHSGEHICSGLICARWHCDNVGFHMGADTVTIDFNADISWQELLEIEAEANAYIYGDHPVDIRTCRGAELDAVEYRSKKALEGDVRIVSFDGADCCACCGTHVARSGQVGLVKFLSCQKFREGVRIEMLAGERALRYLSGVYEAARGVGQKLSVKPGEILAAVEKQAEELSAAKNRASELEGEVFAAEAKALAGQSDVLLFKPAMQGGSLRRLADAVAGVCGGLTAVFSGDGENYSYALIHAGGEDISQRVRTMNEALSGRGGGRNGFAQGSVRAAREEIEAFFKA